MAEGQRRRASSCANDHPCRCLYPTRGTLSSPSIPSNHPNGEILWNRCWSDGNHWTSSSRWSYGTCGSPSSLENRLNEGVGIYSYHRRGESQRRDGTVDENDLTSEGGSAARG